MTTRNDREYSITVIKDYLLQLQEKICLSLEKEDAKEKFIADDWLREEGGGGKTCVLSEGPLIERGAVNFSHITGTRLPPSATIRHPQFNANPYEALGLSLVIHPRNPYVPTVHMNLFKDLVSNLIFTLYLHFTEKNS